MSSQNNPFFYQYCEIIVTNGNFDVSRKKFLRCSTQEGITEKEVQDYLFNNFCCDAKPKLDRTGLDGEGYFWEREKHSVGVFPRMTVPVYAQDAPYITLLMKVAPELFN